MRVISLQAENFKRLQVVEIVPDGDVVTISGANGSGKSSLLDSIATALGGAEETPAMPIRRGEESARIRLDLGDVVVTRRFRAGRDPQLVVESADGARYPSPQRMLDELVGRIAFDPLAFARARPKEQLETLRPLVKLTVDLDALERASTADYEARRDVNREVARLRAQADGIVVGDEPLPTPEEMESLDALARELAEAGERNAAREREAAERARMARDLEAHRDAHRHGQRQVEGVEAQIAKLQAEIESRRGEIEAIRGEMARRREAGEALADAVHKLEADRPLGDPIDTAALAARVAEVRRANEAVETERRRRASRAAIEEEHAAKKARAASLTDAIQRRTDEKRAALAAASYPVPGLALGDVGVLLDGVPFEQASQAQKVRVSCALAMAANPKLRVLLVRDGSLLDDAGLAALAEATAAGGYQLWIERTDTSGRVGIVMEDGRVRGAEPERVEGFAE